MPTFKRGSKLGQSLEEKGILPPKQPKKKRKRNKYGAQKATAGDGTKFDSKKEARRYGELQVMLAMGVIRDLELQVEYPLEVNGVLVCSYRADFRYNLKWPPATVVEDAKGFRTREYQIKKRLMKAVHGIDISEV
jgi:hypothetical protein